MKFYHYFLNGSPEYLARYYWWAYLWRYAVWFFDHQFIINVILFGQYKKLKEITLSQINNIHEQTLQLACVYGNLTPGIINKISPTPLHITDVATIQLKTIRKKITFDSNLIATRMNAEQLGYKDNSFKKIIIFFLLHELPKEARIKALSECLRVTSTGGVLIITEYNKLPVKHFLYRFYPFRWLLEKLEPFLKTFWTEDLLTILNELGRTFSKKTELINEIKIFSGFYRVVVYRIL